MPQGFGKLDILRPGKCSRGEQANRCGAGLGGRLSYCISPLVLQVSNKRLNGRTQSGSDVVYNWRRSSKTQVRVPRPHWIIIKICGSSGSENE